jgi:polyhydroxyalkanoate synthesis regulator phasin
MTPQLRGDLSPNQTMVQISILARRIESLEVHRRGLDEAAEPFDSEDGAENWRMLFDSIDPPDVVARNGVTGCYSAVVNNYVELLKTSAYLVGLTDHKKDHAKEAIDLVRADGALSEEQAKRLHQLFVFEGRVQHASLAVNGDEVLEAVQLLRSEAPRLIKNAVAWLSRHGVEF